MSDQNKMSPYNINTNTLITSDKTEEKFQRGDLVDPT